MCATQADERDETKRNENENEKRDRKDNNNNDENDRTKQHPSLHYYRRQWPSPFFANPHLFLFSCFFVCFSFSTVFVLFVFLLGHAVLSSVDERKYAIRR